MDRIENFAVIPAKDQIAFATALLKTINSEKTFHDEVQFEIVGVEPDDITGGLTIDISHSDPIKVYRDASWTCAREEEASDEPTDFETDFANYLMDDAKKAFKAESTVIEGYKVTLEVVDVDAGETIDVEVEDISHEDAGIGSYDYWGHSGYDSRPYIQVEGVIGKECDCALALFVEPDDTPAVSEEEVPEEV